MEKLTKEQEIIKLLFKDFSASYNSRNISKIIGISHAGAFKILKKMEKREIVKSKRIGKALIYSLNMKNPITCKGIEMALVIEAQNFRRWIEEFRELEDKIKFLILFGSIIRNEKAARDIDLLIVAYKEKFKDIEKIIKETQKYTNRKIHPLIQTLENFTKDVGKKNKVMLEILKIGIVLFGQEEFRKTLELILE